MHRYTPLREVFPRPRGVRLAGELHAVSQFTLADLAELDQWLESSAGDPMESVPPLMADGEPATRRLRLLGAWDLIANFIPTLGEPDAAARLYSPSGRAMQLVLSCARAGREITADRAAELVTACTPAEWAAFERIAWDRPAWKAIARELDPDFESWVETSDEPNDWGKNVIRAIDGDPSRIAALAGLYIGQWRLFCREGEPDWYRCVLKEGETAAECMERAAAVFRPDDGTEGPAFRPGDDDDDHGKGA